MNRQEDNKFLDFSKIVFSPNNEKLAIEVKIEEIDYDTPNEYWTFLLLIPKRERLLNKIIDYLKTGTNIFLAR